MYDKITGTKDIYIFLVLIDNVKLTFKNFKEFTLPSVYNNTFHHFLSLTVTIIKLFNSGHSEKSQIIYICSFNMHFFYYEGIMSTLYVY